MSAEQSPLELWLAEIGSENGALTGNWDPGFDSGRQIVVANLGALHQNLPTTRPVCPPLLPPRLPVADR